MSDSDFTAVMVTLIGAVIVIMTIYGASARDEILAKLDQIIKGEQKEMADLNTLQADVTAEQTVEQSAITLLNGLKAQLDAAGTDPQKLADLSSQIEANTAALAAAVKANTAA